MSIDIPDTVSLVVIDVDTEATASCEDLHGKGENTTYRPDECTHDAVWSSPGYPCGCVPRHLACEGRSRVHLRTRLHAL